MTNEHLPKANSTSTASEFFFDVRSLFYLLKPHETYYEKIEDVPDLTLNVIFLNKPFYLIRKYSNLNKLIENLGIELIFLVYYHRASD